MSKDYFEIDSNSLEEVNEFRIRDGKNPLKSLNGYCMSTGCSCTHNCQVDRRPMCGLFREYDESGIKKDFIYQILGI